MEADQASASPGLSTSCVLMVASRRGRRLEYGEWEAEGAKRHDYSVVGNVEFLTAPRPVEEPAPAKAARNGRKAVPA